MYTLLMKMIGLWIEQMTECATFLCIYNRLNLGIDDYIAACIIAIYVLGIIFLLWFAINGD